MRILRYIICAMLLLTTATAMADSKRFTLVIDAGHGGHDPGAIGAFSKEKDINLSVALLFGRMVEQYCPGVNVIYTRKTDVFIELNERANIANRNKANLFISIHTNALPKGRLASGFESYTLGMARANENLEVAKRENSVITYEKDYQQKYEGFNPNSAESYIMFEFMQDKNMAQSVELAKDIQSCVCRTAGRPNKGVHQAGFLVLRKTSMPSCLIELGFISTPDEETFLNSQDGMNKLAAGIYAAFLNYRNKYDKTIKVPYQVPKEDITTPIFQEQEPKVQPEQKVQRPKPVEVKEEPKAEPKPEVSEQKPETQIKENSVLSAHTLESIYENRNGVFFRIQLFATRRILRQGAEQFKGLDDVDYYMEEGFFKYTVGESKNFQEINERCKRLKKLFPEAFIIAIKDGKKITVAEALRK